MICWLTKRMATVAVRLSSRASAISALTIFSSSLAQLSPAARRAWMDHFEGAPGALGKAFRAEAGIDGADRRQTRRQTARFGRQFHLGRRPLRAARHGDHVIGLLAGREALARGLFRAGPASQDTAQPQSKKNRHHGKKNDIDEL